MHKICMLHFIFFFFFFFFQAEDGIRDIGVTGVQTCALPILPVAIKAAFGGGGRGLKVARTVEEIPELFDSAVREAVSAFGRGECFVERFLDTPRHVEAQVLADTHGNVVVVGTRDCSLQRRNQKLVEEAPAPFLTDEQRARIHESAKAICSEAGYHGAGTVEYIVGAAGSIPSRGGNTRLQVEHPVSEETAGIDLVRQQFRIARGQELAITEDPAPRGHSIEFRINAEDAGRNFMPAPGPVTRLEIPQGPGVRWDSGVETGGEVAGAFDSMLAKLIVTGATREEALQRSRRALDELVVEGMPTVIPFHRAVVRDEAFTSEPFTVHTRWIETEWDNQVPPHDAAVAGHGEEDPRQTVVVEVGGRRLEVSLPAGLVAGGGAAAGVPAKPRRRGGGHGGSGASGDSLTSPMQGTIVKVAVEEGAPVAEGDLVVVLEAMKMEQPIAAHRSGTVTGLSAEVGATVASGAVICTIADAAG